MPTSRRRRISTSSQLYPPHIRMTSDLFVDVVLMLWRCRV